MSLATGDVSPLPATSPSDATAPSDASLEIQRLVAENARLRAEMEVEEKAAKAMKAAAVAKIATAAAELESSLMKRVL